MTLSSTSRTHKDHSNWTAVMGCTAWARRISDGDASESPRYFTFPSSTNFFISPTWKTSSKLRSKIMFSRRASCNRFHHCMISSFIIIASLLLRNVFNCGGHLLADLFPVKNTMFPWPGAKLVAWDFKKLFSSNHDYCSISLVILDVATGGSWLLTFGEK